jgi:hypothetical protein
LGANGKLLGNSQQFRWAVRATKQANLASK